MSKLRKIGFVVDSTFGYKVDDDVSVVTLKVNIDGNEYVEGSFDEKIVIQALKEKKHVKTSQPSPNMFFEAFEKQFELGYEQIICLTISKGLSGTVNGATVAKGMVDNNERITIIDTQTVHVGAKYVLEEALKLANEGKSLEEVIERINEIINDGALIFSVDDLQTLARNGRLGKITAIMGNLLRIKPILKFKAGVLEMESKVRGLMGVINYIANQVTEMLHNEKVVVRITYVDNLDYATTLENKIKSLNSSKIKVKVDGILSPVVSAHVGLGGMGIYLTSK